MTLYRPVYVPHFAFVAVGVADSVPFFVYYDMVVCVVIRIIVDLYISSFELYGVFASEVGCFRIMAKLIPLTFVLI